jgi:hypothetical protein
MEYQAAFGTGQIPMDPPRSEAQVASGYEANGCMRFDWVATGCCNPALGPGEPDANGTCCYMACTGVCCGRPLVVAGEAIVAPVQRRADWTMALALGTSLPPSAARPIARLWLDDARMEHASIASFARFALELMALGAPSQLVADAHRAGLDEIEHARVCFSIAAALSGEVLGPGPLSAGGLVPRSLFDALRAAVHEGCVGEALAAGIAREQARRTTDPVLAARLETIAEDELRHAELAYRFVAWAVGVHGESASRVVTEAFEHALSTPPQVPEVPRIDAELLHRGGRLTSEEWERTARLLLEDVVKPAARASTRARAA